MHSSCTNLYSSCDVNTIVIFFSTIVIMVRFQYRPALIHIHIHTNTPTFVDEMISRNQAHVGRRLARV